MTHTVSVIALMAGAILFIGGFAGGFVLQNYMGNRPYSENPHQPISESLVIEGYASKLLTKFAIEFNLRNTGTTNILIADVELNGQSNQTAQGVSDGWNGTTVLSPNQMGLLYVYSPAYIQVINESMPQLSTTPTETQLQNLEVWINSFNCTFTFVTNTAHQYNYTISRLGFELYYSLVSWAESLTYTFMGTEQLTITQVVFGGTTTKYINVTLQNTGTSPITVNEIWVGSVKQWSTGTTVQANSQTIVQVTYTWSNGYNYQLKVVTAKGNQFYYSATAPSA